MLKHLRSQTSQETIHQLAVTEIGNTESNLVHSIDVSCDRTSLLHLRQLVSGRIQDSVGVKYANIRNLTTSYDIAVKSKCWLYSQMAAGPTIRVLRY